MNAPTKTNRNAADKNDKVSLPDSNSYMHQTILNLYKSGIAIDVISSQTGISQEEVNKIIQDAEQQRQQQGQISYPSLLQSFSPNSQVDLKYVIRMAQTRVWKALEGEPGFVISFVETQDILEKFGKSKVSLVILNVDLVSSTRLSMTLPLDRLTMIIQAFNQEMSMIIKAFNGYVLKYVGDAVLAFFIVPRNQSGAKVA
jgi:adenylate cyclase